MNRKKQHHEYSIIVGMDGLQRILEQTVFYGKEKLIDLCWDDVGRIIPIVL